jgi:hypothetical protein
MEVNYDISPFEDKYKNDQGFQITVDMPIVNRGTYYMMMMMMMMMMTVGVLGLFQMFLIQSCFTAMRP